MSAGDPTRDPQDPAQDPARDATADAAQDPWRRQRETLGAYLRGQRRLANLSLRDLAELTKVSNPYLSQIERGLHEPSVRVLGAIAKALDLSADTLLAQVGLRSDPAADVTDADAGRPDEPAGDAVWDEPPPPEDPAEAAERAIRADPRLTDAQRDALLTVYRSFVAPTG